MTGSTSGTLYLIGVGPGDPELLTLKAARLLGTAGVVAYPVSNADTTVALDIARQHLNPRALLEPVHIPMTVTPDEAQPAKHGIYREAAGRIATHLGAGRDVAYLCEGDPLFYGTAIYLLSLLRDTQLIEVVPGIASITAAAASMARPLSTKSESLTILTGPAPDAALRPRLELGGSFAIMKIGRHFDRIRALLSATGLADHAVLVEHATRPQQRTARLIDLPEGPKPYFSLILCRSGAESWP